jgi:hypothetical protein
LRHGASIPRSAAFINISVSLGKIRSVNITSARYWIASAAALLVIAVLFVGMQLHSMSSDLSRMSVRVETLASMDRKLSTTNELLMQTNASLTKMLAQSVEANQSLGRMKSDLSVMSHKLAGSFLFRGVK